ncbi:hypothetical protein [Bosea sp. TAF32]|uniref:hypothetical protein n=1 Tax=Bosea sp. TAF32 TaxID=3237482 RepID=UPI003F8E4260
MALEDINHAFAAAHVNSLAFGIDKQIVGIPAGADGARPAPVLGRKGNQSRRRTGDGEHLMRVRINGEREVRAQIGERQRFDLSLCRQIDDRDLVVLGTLTKAWA